MSLENSFCRHRDRYMRLAPLCPTLFISASVWNCELYWVSQCWFVLNVPFCTLGFHKFPLLWMWCLIYRTTVLWAWNAFSFTFHLSHSDFSTNWLFSIETMPNFFCILRNGVNMMMSSSFPLDCPSPQYSDTTGSSLLATSIIIEINISSSDSVHWVSDHSIALWVISEFMFNLISMISTVLIFLGGQYFLSILNFDNLILRYNALWTYLISYCSLIISPLACWPPFFFYPLSPPPPVVVFFSFFLSFIFFL